MALFLILSTAALFAGPLLLHFAIRERSTHYFIDAFVIFSVFGIVLFHVLPESVVHGGLWAICAALFGLISPVLTGRLFKSGSCHIHHTLLSVASIGVFAHAMLDGMVLYGTSHLLACAVVLHRIPEGMGIWRFFAGRVGQKLGLFALFFVAGATTFGFFFGEMIVHYLDEQMIAIFEGLMAGVLLHVIFHRRHLSSSEASETAIIRKKRISEGLGALCGASLVFILIMVNPIEHSHAHAESPVRIENNEL